jgi:hypothetical protein
MEEQAMNLKLVLTLTVVLASAPVLFVHQGFRPDLRPLTGWVADRGETEQAEAPAGGHGVDCVVIGPDLFRPGTRVGNAGSGNRAQWTLPLGDNLSCATASTDGV